MKHLAVSKHFQKEFGRLPVEDKNTVVRALKELLAGLKLHRMPISLGFKKINCDKYEIRAGLRLRIVMKLDGDTLACHLIGNHEAVRRYLKEYRNK